ncbi:MAG: outer membrane lipoprotein-sorting protein [Bacteroidales bacterium]|nr:outer membrane lipoprotein-sorting protein [Bacteroidales bacterium]
MKKLFSLTFTILIAAFFTVIQGQDLSEILDQHFSVVGQEKLAEVKTITVYGKIIQIGTEFSFVQRMKNPNKFILEADIQGQKMIQAFDGENGWMIVPWMSPDPQDLTGIQLKQAKEQTNIEGDLYNWEEKGHQAEYLGTEDVEGTETYKIKLTKKEGDEIFYFIDSESYVILKETRKMTVQENEIEIESFPGNYEMINGIAFPMSIKTSTMGQETEILFDSVKIDLELDDSIFIRPVQEDTEEIEEIK